MSFLSRLLGTEPDPRERLRPLWHKVVEIARKPHWYSNCKVADSVAGRFDMITAVLSVVMVRIESSELKPDASFNLPSTRKFRVVGNYISPRRTTRAELRGHGRRRSAALNLLSRGGRVSLGNPRR